VVNLEGRLQRQRRAVMAPCPDELAWIAKLATRFDVELSAHASLVFGELSPRLFGGISFGDVGEQSELPPRAPETRDAKAVPGTKVPGTGLRLVAYRPLFSGAAVDRTPELDFQKPDAEVQLAAADAKARSISNGQLVTVSSNGTSVDLRARIAKDLAAGVVRIAGSHAGELHEFVEVTPHA